MKTKKLVLISSSFLCVTILALFPNVLAGSTYFTPARHWAESGWGYCIYGSVSDYKYNDNYCLVWYGTYDVANDPNCQIRACVDTDKLKSAVGIIDEITVYWDFGHSTTYPIPSWTSCQWWVYIYNFDESQWDLLELGLTYGVESDSEDITSDVSDYIREDPSDSSEYEIYLKLMTKSGGYYLWIDQLNAQVHWTY